MTPGHVIAIFKGLNRKDRVLLGRELTCAGFAGWLAQAWDQLEEADLALLVSVGAALWREGLGKQAAGAANDPRM